MSSPCLSGSRTYRLDLEIVKSPSTSTITSQTSSPSSTLSEFSNSPLAISTRKPRTPRKRPNQTYNEAAALLSSAYPNIFSAKHLTNPSKFSKPHESAPLLDESSELLLPFRVFDNSGFLVHQPVRDVPAGFFNEPKVSSLMSPSDKSCQSSSSSTTAATWEVDSMEVCDGYLEEMDFDAESILDEEIEEGIDSIMGNPSDSNGILFESKNNSTNGGGGGGGRVVNPCFGNHMGWFNLGGGFQFGFGMVGMRRGVRALRRVPDGNWPTFPVVDMFQITPRLNATGSPNPNSNAKPKLKLSLPKSNSGDKKKKKKVEKPMTESKISGLVKENSVSEVANSGLLLKLNYDDVLEAWSGRGLPFPEEILGAEGNDASARWAQMDLFSESGGLLREASVLRYKEKRRTRLFSKKIRYQVRKVNADRRPRMKGRFVRRPNSSGSHQRRQD